MSPYIDDPDFQLFVGDALEVLQAMPDESVHCCVTSPPYWGLRDYGTGTWAGGDTDCDHKAPPSGGPNPERYTPGGGEMWRTANDKLEQGVCGKCGATRTDQQLGLEPTPDEYVTRMVAVFREVRRVLRADGTLWLNIGDSYASQGGPLTYDFNSILGGKPEVQDYQVNRKAPPGLKPKDLVGIPWRLAFALQADGWYLRSDIIWSKPNPMPESVTDRPTKAHEYLFLLTKSPRYFYDADAIREPFDARPQQRLTPVTEQPLAAARRAAGVEQGNPQGGAHVSRFKVQDETLDVCGCAEAGCGWTFEPANCGCACHVPENRGPDGRRVTIVVGKDGSEQHRNGERWPDPSGRNKRTVWEIATEPYPDAHFATFPQALVEPCIKAGTSEHGCCPVCGAPWVRIVSDRTPPSRDTRTPGAHTPTGTDKLSGAKMQEWLDANPRVTTGWRPSCKCRGVSYSGLDRNRKTISTSEPPEPIPCVVLDAFLGSGTTAQVARRLGRRCVGIELNREYAQLAARRLQQQSLFA